MDGFFYSVGLLPSDRLNASFVNGKHEIDAAVLIQQAIKTLQVVLKSVKLVKEVEDIWEGKAEEKLYTTVYTNS